MKTLERIKKVCQKQQLQIEEAETADFRVQSIRVH